MAVIVRVLEDAAEAFFAGSMNNKHSALKGQLHAAAKPQHANSSGSGLSLQTAKLDVKAASFGGASPGSRAADPLSFRCKSGSLLPHAVSSAHDHIEHKRSRSKSELY